MHLLIDAVIEDARRFTSGLKTWLEGMPERIGMTPITPAIVQRHGEIVAGVTILAESHISVHGDLSQGQAWADMFSCKPFDADAAALALEEIGLKGWRASILERGLEYLPPPAVSGQ